MIKPDSGYYGLSQVTVNAYPEGYGGAYRELWYYTTTYAYRASNFSFTGITKTVTDSSISTWTMGYLGDWRTDIGGWPEGKTKDSTYKYTALVSNTLTLKDAYIFVNLYGGNTYWRFCASCITESEYSASTITISNRISQTTASTSNIIHGGTGVTVKVNDATSSASTMTYGGTLGPFTGQYRIILFTEYASSAQQMASLRAFLTNLVICPGKFIPATTAI